MQLCPTPTDPDPLTNCVPGSDSDPMPVKPLLATHGPEAVTGAAMVSVGAPCANADESESDTCRFVSGFGPVFLTSIEYGTSNAAGPTTVGSPARTSTDRLCGGTASSTSVALLFAGTGSVTPLGTVAIAVFAIDSGASPATVAGTENVAVPPASRLMAVERLPAPPLTHEEPAVATHVQLPNVSPAGAVSVNVAPVTAFGP